MKLNPNQALIHYPNILLSHKFRFHPRNQSLFSKENHIHEKHPFFFRKSYPNSSSPLFLPSPFIPFSSSISFSVQFHLDFPLSSLFFFTLFQPHTHTHIHMYILQFDLTLLNVQENVSSACNLQSCYPGWIFTSARRHAGRIGRGAEEKTRSSVLTSIFWNDVIDIRFCHAFFLFFFFFLLIATSGMTRTQRKHEKVRVDGI